MKLLAQQRDLQVLMLFSLDFCRLSSVNMCDDLVFTSYDLIFNIAVASRIV